MLNFELKDGDGFALVILHGLVSLDAWDEVLHRISAQLPSGHPARRVVVDMRSALGYLGIPERTAVGSLMARRLGHMQKVAILVEAEKITNVVRDAAHRHGLNLDLFHQYDDATAWVTS